MLQAGILAVAAYTLAADDLCTSMFNVEFSPGKQMSVIHDLDAGGCCLACAQTPGCLGFSIDTNRLCALKDQTDIINNKTGVMSGLVQGPAPPPSPVPTPSVPTPPPPPPPTPLPPGGSIDGQFQLVKVFDGEQFYLEIDGEPTSGSMLKMSKTGTVWSYTPDSQRIDNKAGLCLDIPGGNAVVGQELWVWACDDGLATQQWVYELNANNAPDRIQHCPNGDCEQASCVAPESSTVGEGTSLVLARCSYSSFAAQKWALEAVGLLQSDTEVF